MDNQKHTAEPWPECDTDEVINAADYSRARVCVNALAGIDDPELWVAQMKFMDSDHTASLEIIGELTKQRDELLAQHAMLQESNENWMDGFNDIKSQRDELLAALKKLREDAYNAYADSSCNDAFTIADAIIAKAETAK